MKREFTITRALFTSGNSTNTHHISFFGGAVHFAGAAVFRFKTHTNFPHRKSKSVLNRFCFSAGANPLRREHIPRLTRFHAFSSFVYNKKSKIFTF